MALLKVYDLCMHIIHPFLHLVSPIFNKESLVNASAILFSKDLDPTSGFMEQAWRTKNP